jgi:hypothetical protein
VTRREAGAVLGVLGILVAITVPELGSQAWPFQVRSGGTDPQGPRMAREGADRDFDIAPLRPAPGGGLWSRSAPLSSLRAHHPARGRCAPRRSRGY